MADRKHEVYKLYKVNGDKVERLNKECPKCGPGFFMANHKDRKVCGKCSFTERPAAEKPKEEAAPAKEVKSEAPAEKPAE